MIRSGLSLVRYTYRSYGYVAVTTGLCELKALEREVALRVGRGRHGKPIMPANEDHSNCGSERPSMFHSDRFQKDIRSRSVWHLWDSAPLDNTGIWAWEKSFEEFSSCIKVISNGFVGVCASYSLPSIGKFVKGISGYNMPTDKLHGWITFRRLLSQDWTGKHWMIPALLSQVYFNLRTHNADALIYFQWCNTV